MNGRTLTSPLPQCKQWGITESCPYGYGFCLSLEQGYALWSPGTLAIHLPSLLGGTLAARVNAGQRAGMPAEMHA